MKLLSTLAIAAAAAVAIAAATPATTHAQGAKSKGKVACQQKAGRGWGASTDSARFQAWEAVLQDTDWGMWAVWITTGAKVGSAASGYTVRNMREKCGNDGSSRVCTIRAQLCK
ncbi:MAG: hypothetical protein RLZ98_1934 [Pseudomonadota bacterium]|jgi:hypothetical protein